MNSIKDIRGTCKELTDDELFDLMVQDYKESLEDCDPQRS